MSKMLLIIFFGNYVLAGGVYNIFVENETKEMITVNIHQSSRLSLGAGRIVPVPPNQRRGVLQIINRGGRGVGMGGGFKMYSADAVHPKAVFRLKQRVQVRGFGSFNKISFGVDNSPLFDDSSIYVEIVNQNRLPLQVSYRKINNDIEYIFSYPSLGGDKWKLKSADSNKTGLSLLNQTLGLGGSGGSGIYSGCNWYGIQREVKPQKAMIKFTEQIYYNGTKKGCTHIDDLYNRALEDVVYYTTNQNNLWLYDSNYRFLMHFVR